MEIQVNQKTALVFGASGLVGSALTRQLLDHPAYSQVYTFGRSPLKMEHPKLHQYQVDLKDEHTFEKQLKGQDLFLCLGTTMAKAGSKEAFYQVDYTYNYSIAKLASENGVNQLILISAVGANPDSLFFYNRVKGELEEALKKLDFWAMHILRPSVLLGDRKETRFGEALGARLLLGAHRLSGGRLGRYEPVEDDTVAAAMIRCAQQLKQGIFIHSSDKLKDLAGRSDLLPGAQ
ncbi:MAG: NAD(P)H-binding protein [Bacteroidetes bacterium]|nr:NAD(P)H-binding protein [Bacteroidota bacterium]